MRQMAYEHPTWGQERIANVLLVDANILIYHFSGVSLACRAFLPLPAERCSLNNVTKPSLAIGKPVCHSQLSDHLTCFLWTTTDSV